MDMNGLLSKYEYDLNGMEVGDWFLGCPECGFQHDKNCITNNKCPNCQTNLNICTVTPKDKEKKNERNTKIRRELF